MYELLPVLLLLSACSTALPPVETAGPARFPIEKGDVLPLQDEGAHPSVDSGFDLAFDGCVRDRCGIHFLPAGATRSRWLARGTQPVISPNGRWVTFRCERSRRPTPAQSADNGNDEVCLVPSDGGEATYLTRNWVGDYSTSWSPDSQRIAFSSGRAMEPNYNNDIYVMDRDGSNVIEVTHQAGVDEYMTWSPDGDHLIWTCNQGEYDEIRQPTVDLCRAAPVENAEIEVLTDFGYDRCMSPSYSPDARYVATNCEHDAAGRDSDIYVVDLHRAEMRKLTDGRDFMPKWSQDGEAIIFRRGDGLKAVAADGSPVAALRLPVRVDGEFDIHYPSQVATAQRSRTNGTPGDCPVTQLSFASHRGRSPQIYRLDVRRPQRVRRVTSLDGWVTDPTWSPDATRMAFRWLDPEGDVGVYVAEADRSDPQLLASEAATPSWSPDGRSIAYTKLADDTKGLWIADVEAALDGRSEAHRQVTSVSTTTVEEFPSWSPDGTRLIFNSQRAGNSDIWVVNVDGTGLRNLTRHPALDSPASWSPDGGHIVFGSTRRSPSGAPMRLVGDIYVMEADGSDVRRLTHAPRGSYGPAWSPDGRRIAFNSQRDGNSEVYVMRADGTRERRLTRHREDDGFVAWVGRCPG